MSAKRNRALFAFFVFSDELIVAVVVDACSVCCSWGALSKCPSLGLVFTPFVQSETRVSARVRFVSCSFVVRVPRKPCRGHEFGWWHWPLPFSQAYVTHSSTFGCYFEIPTVSTTVCLCLFQSSLAHWHECVRCRCSCGNGHTLSGAGSCISGGVSNTVTSSNGVVGGGQDNEVARDYATIGGGRDNVVVGAYAAICGGQSNSARGDYASVGGGSKNIATLSATVAGGKNNAANAQFGSIGGGYLNSLSGYAAHIGGGVGNSAYAKYSFVAGGSANLASAEFASVGGGSNNRVAGTYSAIGGGKFNTVSSTGAFAVLAGGHANKAVSAFAVVSGGAGNTATAEYAVVGGGFENRATGTGAAVVGGSANDAAGNHSLALGSAASAAHNNSAVLGFGLTKCYSIARHSVSVCAPNGFFINGYLLNASAFDDVTFLRQYVVGLVLPIDRAVPHLLGGFTHVHSAALVQENFGPRSAAGATWRQCIQRAWIHSRTSERRFGYSTTARRHAVCHSIPAG